MSAFNKYDKLMEYRQNVMREAGFLVPIDQHFKGYFAGYKKSKKDYGNQVFMKNPDGTPITLAQSRLLKLKRKINEAIARVTNA